MPTKTLATDPDVRVWENVVRFVDEPSPAAAKELLKLQFSDADRQRMRELAAKARAGALTADEERLTDTYERLGCLLDILHSKLRLVLKRRRKPA